MSLSPPGVIIQANKAKSKMLADAVIAGAGGGEIYVEPSLFPHDRTPVIVGLWPTTARWLHYFQREQRPYVYIDNGYFNGYPHGPYFRATMNGLQYFEQSPHDVDRTRWQALNIPLKPWRRGENVLVVLQTEQWFEMLGLDRQKWLDRVLADLDGIVKRPVKVRDKLKNPATTFYEDLKSADSVVAFSSNTLIQAVVEGVGVFPRGVCAATFLGGHMLANINEPFHPDFREDVLADLANYQFTLDEIQFGMMWQKMTAEDPQYFRGLG